MALCHNCDDVRIEYEGNGTQTDYTFPFEYNEKGDVAVAFWNEDYFVWEKVETGWSFLNDTTIRFDEAPASGQKFIIYRCTDLVPLPAEFYPGTAIRAQDLNDNFFVLRSAIEEARCAIERQDNLNEEKYWNKIPYEQEPDENNPDVGETIYSTGEWVCSDEAVASTAAICDHVEEQIDLLKVDEADQQNSRWIKDGLNDDDEHFATTAALVERYDPFFQEETPTNLPPYQIPGKLWFDNDEIITSVWDQENQTWVASGLSGPPGPIGATGTYQTIVSDTAPTRRVDQTPLQNGDVWFNSLTAELYVRYDDGNPEGERGIQWVQALAGRGAQGEDGPQGEFGPPGHVIISDSPPTEYPALAGSEARPLEPGDLWFDSLIVMLYVYYEDDNGPGQWVAVSKTGPEGPQGADGGIEEAPEDGEIYGRQDGAWVEIPELLFENPLALDADTQTVSFEIDNLLSI